MPEERYPSDEADRFMVRMPPGMRKAIAEQAKQNNRSMNAEIVARLQATLEGKPTFTWGPGGGPTEVAKRAEVVTMNWDAKLDELLREIQDMKRRALGERVPAKKKR